MPKLTPRMRYVRDAQLAGHTYEQAVEIWNAAEEIAAGYETVGQTALNATPADIRADVANWRALRAAGL